MFEYGSINMVADALSRLEEEDADEDVLHPLHNKNFNAISTKRKHIIKSTNL